MSYPKMMYHPHAQQAILGHSYGEGRPALRQPVEVHSEDQEEYYKAQGYRADGTGSDLPVGYVYVEYPKWVDGVLVKSEAEHSALKDAAAAAEKASKKAAK